MPRALPFLLVLVASGIACGGRVASSSEQTEGDRAGRPAPTGTSISSPPQPGTSPVPPPDLPPPPPRAPSLYTAYAWAGGLDHIEIFKADFATDTCVQVHLASPGSSTPGEPFGSISTPADWSVVSADRSKGASACKPEQSRQPLPADDGKGVVSWVVSAGSFFPCSLDIHVSLIFQGSKAAEQLDADGLAVDNCK